MAQLLDPISPGEILLEEFLRPPGISHSQLARAIGMPVSHVVGIINGTHAITADMARGLGQYFGTSAEMWLTLQSQYDLRIGQRILRSSTVTAMAQLDTGEGKCSTASTSDVLDRATPGGSRKKR